MNWYKEIKIALPITEKDPPVHYTNIGHRMPSNYNSVLNRRKIVYAEIWYINDKWEFISVPVTDSNTHVSEFQADVFLHGIARGRYDESSDGDKYVSVLLDYGVQAHHPGREEYFMNRIEKILDEKYGNPNIYRYANKEIKTALPVMEKDIHGLDYLDIGHEHSYNQRGESPVKSELWLITKNWEMLAIPRKGGNTHNSIFGDKVFDAIAKGRFDEFGDGEKKASLIMDYTLGENPRRLEHMTKRVESFLDNYYGNPDIYRWN
jgi:hypothetical protein